MATHPHTHLLYQSSGFLTQMLISPKNVKFSCPLHCREGKHGIPTELQDQACSIQLKSNMEVEQIIVY